MFRQASCNPWCSLPPNKKLIRNSKRETPHADNCQIEFQSGTRFALHKLRKPAVAESIVNPQRQQRLLQLCTLASHEPDSRRLLHLVTQINRLYEEDRAEGHVERPKKSKPSAPTGRLFLVPRRNEIRLR